MDVKSSAIRIVYLKKLIRYIKEDYTIVFIDESGFNLVNSKYKTWINNKINTQHYSASKND
jgi:hypothetical protein